MNKRSKIVPLYEFDEHNEAFYFWHKARYEGYIRQPLDLFHIDAHSDVGEPRVFRKPVYFPNNSKDNYLEYYKDFVKSELNIGNFILPAVLSGVIKNIYFIYPRWRRLKPVRKKMNIGSAFGEGKILKYGIKREKDSDPKTVFKALPDLKYFNYYAYGMERIPKNRKVILDIDLDYFACRDSILNNISYELEITEEQSLNKEMVLNDNTLQFSGLDFSFEEKNNKYFVKIGHKKVKDISYLPSKEEIESEINALVSTLQAKKTMPVVITICRSCVSGHCPVDYHEFIEHRLKQRLITLFNARIDDRLDNPY